MILGIGHDLVEIDRVKHIVERFGQSFINKLLHQEEITHFGTRIDLSNKNISFFLASRFAAKEAAVKALGTGFSGNIGFHDILIVSDALSKPILLLKGSAEKKAKELGVIHSFVSITHEKSIAGAMVVLEGENK